MLRYFVAGNFWLAFALILLLAKGVARYEPTFFTVFGVGWIKPEVFWFAVITAFVAAVLCMLGWQKTMSSVT